MIMNNRTHCMVEQMSAAFELQKHYTQEHTIQNEKHAPVIKAWLNGTGPPQLFVYYQPPQRINPETGYIQMLQGREEFSVMDGEGAIRLTGKACYFLRCLAPGNPIKDNVANDESVLFGEISVDGQSSHSKTALVHTLNTLVNNIYKPMIERMSAEDWGVCDAEAKREFTVVFEKFSRELAEAIKSLTNVMTLEKYPEKWEKQARDVRAAAGHNIKYNNDMITDFMKIFGDWSDKIEAELNNTTDAERKPQDQQGPADELENWKDRMRKLTAVNEQLRSQNCTMVYEVLFAVSNSDANKHADSGIYLALSTWRSLILRVTESLNEAKDNVKYLQTLERFIEPLYSGTPVTIRESLPVLLNSIKMIHTVARYYNTEEKMTGLFVKITNQMIINCKNYILTFRRKMSTSVKPVSSKKKMQLDDDAILWDPEQVPHEELIEVLKQCLALHETYVAQYEFTKKRLEHMPKTKQFDFSTTKIFGRFDLFKRRVSKLIELFLTIVQFKTLNMHNLEHIEPILQEFDKYVTKFKGQNHRLLEYREDRFDRDFVEFNVEISNVETLLQQYINSKFENITNIVDSLRLLRKFEAILSRETLRTGLRAKFTGLFASYGQEIEKIKADYQRDKEKPPIVRNLPPVAGAITWSRHLFYRISVPMEQFPQDLVRQRSAFIRNTVKNHNSLGYTLFSYEYMWRKEWQKEVDRAKAGLQATLFIRHYQNLKLYVNFDSEILTLIREAKCLARIGIEIPESAKIVLLQEEKFKNYNNQLQYVVRERVRVVNKIRPNTRSLLAPHIDDLERRLRPGICSLTWTSMNIDGFLHHVHVGLAKLDQLIININDIMENRIENNLKALSKTVLVDLPQESSTFTLDEFVEMQRHWIENASKKLRSKNYEVEGAVEDLLQTICSYQLDPTVHPIPMEDIIRLSKYYNWSMYQALLHATKFSLNQMKERICGRSVGNKKQSDLKPFFEVEVYLDGHETALQPSLTDVQRSINIAASEVLKSTRQVQNWNQKDLPEEERKPFYTWIARDKEIVKVILLLTGSIQGTKNFVYLFQKSFEKFNWLWDTEMDAVLRAFNAKNPTLEDYEAKYKEFQVATDEVDAIEDYHTIGALSLKTERVKTSLKEWIDKWKHRFSSDLNKKAKRNLEFLMDELKQIQLKIDKPAQSIDSLGSVMSALEEIRNKQSSFSIEIRPITEMYDLLTAQFGDFLNQDEHEAKDALDKKWTYLKSKADSVRDTMHGQKAKFKHILIDKIKSLIIEVDEFREGFEQHGPLEAGLQPDEALERLKVKTEEYQVIKTKYDELFAGETLFGLPHQQYPKLTKTEEQIALLDKLYGLYQKYQNTVAQWNDTPWPEVKELVIGMQDTALTFQQESLRLPGQLKSWLTYSKLKEEIEDMINVLPLVEGFAKDSIRERHWEEAIALSKHDIPYTSENFVLKNLLDANLLAVAEDCEDIADNADKQLKLENQLKNDISAYYDSCELTITSHNGVPAMIGGPIMDIQQQIEEHMQQLQQFSVMRHVGPFKNEVKEKIGILSHVSDTIEKWLKVQSLWSTLVTVFIGGDIAKQLPQESQRFLKVHKIWLRIMERANEQPNVVASCTNDILVSQLGGLQSELEHCQMKLETYLEGKKGIFPRFYFCSSKNLLKILSSGSDPENLQEFFESLFAGIHKVTFNEDDHKQIDVIHMVYYGCREDLELYREVRAEGPVEDWLNVLCEEMQFTVRQECRAGAQNASSLPLKEFVEKSISQISLLGIQLKWTVAMEEAITRTNHRDRKEELERKVADVRGTLSELVGMCLEDITDKLKRTKTETLVTIQVHQRDLAGEIRDMYRMNSHKGIHDYDWQKNARVYWKADEGHAIISITDIDFTYGYEFLGVRERLCITPLTDRCYITLAQALGMAYGGAPAGPAGTGKTETTKDLGCTLGISVIVQNCSPEYDYLSMAKIFKGLCMAGLWGCFDEFNRISLPTLSVVAAMVESITIAKRAKVKFFEFPNEGMIPLKAACGYFITMNPGYAGRQELPENLKVLFRGVTMMVPDRGVIMKVKLASVGYDDYERLALKFNILYRLCEMQLSNTRHYDFGLRNILSVLRTAGTNKRLEPAGTDEEMLVCRTLRDINMSKLIFQDIALFIQLLGDIFPTQKEIPNLKHTALEAELAKWLQKLNLQKIPDWYRKIIQLYETSLVRHGIMVVGTAGCGKTTIYKALLKAMSDVKGNPKHVLRILNPKAVTDAQLYGKLDPTTGEWVPGILAEIWKAVNDKRNKVTTWILCDGPVDAIWIESMNTVLDDNRMLTLANGERMPMSDTTKLTFEVKDLNNASPATVSRAGIIYVSEQNLGWRPLIDTWSEDREERKETCHSDERTWLKEMTAKYIEKPKMMKEVALKYTVMLFGIPEVVRATMLLNLLGACLLVYQAKGLPLDRTTFEKVYIYCLTWSMGGLLEADDRCRFHKELLEKSAGPMLPQINASKFLQEKETVFDYYIDLETGQWKMWSPPEWKAPRKIIFSQLLIPTSDSVRAEFIIERIASLPGVRHPEREEQGLQHTLLVGAPGTAKTSIVLMYASTFDGDLVSFKRLNFSSATKPVNFQQGLMAELTKVQATTYRPHSNKELVVFMDDFSMPKINTWLDQETLEITRQVIEQRGLYSLDPDEAGKLHKFEKLKYLAAMRHPTGGRNNIPSRSMRHFFCMNLTPTSNRSVQNIYGQILDAIISTKRKYDQKIIAMKSLIIDATIALWEAVRKRMMPTPQKFHYEFNIRDLSRIFQGVARVAQAYEYKVIQNTTLLNPKIDPQLYMVGLWRHEATRTLQDKLINPEDKAAFTKMLDQITKEKYCEACDIPEDEILIELIFADFQRDAEIDEYGSVLSDAPYVYEACPSVDKIKKRVNVRLDEYNEKWPAKMMPLVIFDDALFHLLRLTRTVNAPAGNSLLVGVGGSGKQSLTKLSAFICHHRHFQIQLTKSYSERTLMEDIKDLFDTVCGQNGQVSFIMTDAEIKNDGFLEAINALLATGEIPGMLNKDDRDMFMLMVKPYLQKEMGKGSEPTTSQLSAYFLNAVRDRLHIILAFSPVGSKFRTRSSMFPSLFSECNIDWFLPWPKEALTDVSNRSLGNFEIEATKEVKQAIVEHMGEVHILCAQATGSYYERFRRNVYVTPKSYLSFIALYKDLYKKKWTGIDQDQRSIKSGLDKLEEAVEGVGEMKKQLLKDDAELQKATKETDELIMVLQVENAAADKKRIEVGETKDMCIAKKAQIEIEKADADRDLKLAMPFVISAEKALGGIRDNDIVELKNASKPFDITKLILDTVEILYQLPLVPVAVKEFMAPGRKPFTFIEDSYGTHSFENLFIKDNLRVSLTHFGNNLKNFINDETIELLEPYLNVKFRDDPDNEVFRGDVAKNASSALQGICNWCRAMSDYTKASKIVKPKLLLLSKKEAELKEAENALEAAKQELEAVIAKKASLDEQYAEKQAIKEKMQADANKLKRKMDQATKLIDSLADNKVRWTESSREFASQKIRLSGDVAKASAFVSYVGPFNTEYRHLLESDYFQGDLEARAIPFTEDLKLTQFLVDEHEVGEWNMQGLPTDELSVQNGIMVTRSARYPLMIDPQSQAINWIKNREPELEANKYVFQLTHPNLRDMLKIPLMDGMPVLIENVENEVDNMLDPLLEKQITVKGRSKLITLGDQQFDYHDNFRLFMTSRMPNPHWSPELAAKTTIIDFAVTQNGLEQQLLGRLISREQKQLEDTLTQVKESVNMSTKLLKKLETDLLMRLATAEGSLLDDVELIDVLGNIKLKSSEVGQSLIDAGQKQEEIGEKREQFRPVAARGAVLYFCIVEMSTVNWMYNVSLNQFLDLFYRGIDESPKAQMVKDRVQFIIDEMTFVTYRYINRGLFEADKTTFKLMMCLRVLMKEDIITAADISLFLKAGAAIDDRNKKFSWMDKKVWDNLTALSKHKFGPDSANFFYKGVIDSVSRNTTEWKTFYESDAPESDEVPDYQEKINADNQLGAFLHLCLVRSVREDRTVLASNRFIADLLGSKFTEPPDDQIADVWTESAPNKPILYLLSTGADPTSMIGEFARTAAHKKFPTKNVSMGEAMEGPALAKIKDGFKNGDWVVLNNCHLSLDFMAEMETILNPKDVEVHEEFRLWITCAPAGDFPLGLLQMAIKVTMEPPRGMRAGLARTYNQMISQDFIEKVEPYEKWRPLTYAACFLHSVVQERRSFGPIGFSIPYEFNASDLDASLIFLEKHLNDCAAKNRRYEWYAMQQMICVIHYGGKITQELDRDLFNTYGELWISESIFGNNFQFNQQNLDPNYVIPDFVEQPSYVQYIRDLPETDSPLVFGLNPSADLTRSLSHSRKLITTLIDIQPTDTSGGGGKTPEQLVKDMIENDFSKMVPEEFDMNWANSQLDKMKHKRLEGSGKTIPLVMFLFQEIQRFQAIIQIVKGWFGNCVQAIDGQIIMSPELAECIKVINNLQVPKPFMYDPSGAEISWLNPSLGGWLGSMADRHHQLATWLSCKDGPTSRPASYWLTGFFNPTGFLTSVRQEISRANAKNGWALDAVLQTNTIPARNQFFAADAKIEGKQIQEPTEGVFVHGLYLEGAAFEKAGTYLKDSAGKELFFPFPNIQIGAECPTAEQNKGPGGVKKAQNTGEVWYECPVYRYPQRTDRYFITKLKILAEPKQDTSKSRKQDSGQKETSASINQWKLRGVALLCQKE